MMNKGKLVILSGFSGAGKGTIIKELMKSYEGKYELSISATTRPKRPGEENGREYFFLSEEQFVSMIQNEEFLEYAQYVTNYYGTPSGYVKEQMQAGKNVILEIEIQGALNVKEKIKDALLLFVSAPDASVLKSRLIGRGTESLEQINNRLKRAAEEIEGIENYDYLIINDSLEDSVRLVDEIITSEQNNRQDLNSKYKISANVEFINKMKKELNRSLKGE